MKGLERLKKGLKLSMKYLSFILALTFFVVSVLFLGWLVWLNYDCYVKSAPEIYEFPNPAPEVRIMEIERLKKTEIQEESKESFFNFSGDTKVIAVKIGGTNLIFWKSGDMPGEVKKYRYPIRLKEQQVIFRKVERMIIRPDAIQLRYSWNKLMFSAVFLLITGIGFLILKFPGSHLVKVAKKVFKKPEEA